MSLSLQWTLNETANGALEITKDAIRTATRDNVQPLALLACERFGATIAISQESRDKVHRAVSEPAEPFLLRFLKARVGYIKGDSVTALSMSMAGLSFLALTTALVSTTDNFEAAKALEKMIEKSAADRTLVPTSHHLKPLLDILEPRLNRIGFTNDVLDWNTWWRHQNDLSAIGRHLVSVNGDTFPSADGLQEVVDAFRKLERIGDSESVTFTLGSCAPWLSAFTYWCVGMPPTIRTAEGKTLLDQPNSRITLVFSHLPEFQDRIRIETLRSFDSFEAVVDYATLSDPQSVGFNGIRGMVSIRKHGEQTLRWRGFESDSPKRALLAAVPYALKQARDLLTQGMTSAPVASALEAVLVDHKYDASPLPSMVGNAFPNEYTISRTMAIYLSLNESDDLSAKKTADLPLDLKRQLVIHKRKDLKVLAEGELVTDMPIVKPYCHEIEEDCPQHKHGMAYMQCLVERFLRDVSEIVANILALSLLDGCLDSTLLYYASPRNDPQDGPARIKDVFQNAIFEILSTGTFASCPVESILIWALALLHHDVFLDVAEKSWVISSFKGQVVFPKVFEANSLPKEGYLELYCIPGILTLENEGTQRFRVAKSNQALNIRQEDLISERVPMTQALNLYPNERLLWQVSVSGDIFWAHLGWSRSSRRVNPFNLLIGLSTAVFASGCAHNSDNPLDKEPSDSIHTSPMQPIPDSPSNGERLIGVVPVKGNRGLRVLALASEGWLGGKGCWPVVSRGACLACCLDICRLACYNFIVS